MPNPTEWVVAADVDLIEVDDNPSLEELWGRRILRSLYRCPASGHLWVFWDGFDAPPAGYAPIDDAGR